MATQGTILIVDDNPSVIDSLTLFLKRKVAKIISTESPNDIPTILSKHQVDVVILDMNFELTENTGKEGLNWLKEIKKLDPNQVVIMITAYGDVALAVEALKEGASDFILKPWDNQKLLATLNSAMELSRSKREVSHLRTEQADLKQSINKNSQAIIGQSPPMQEVFQVISKVAPTDANVLVLGENGTGKELVAREIHRLSARASGIFLTIDMGTITETLFESELFGHKKGAFTDAKDDKMGRLALAHGGTLFLDEIGNLSQPMQAKLLTVLQNREFTPVGDTKTKPIDVRLICATNRNVGEMVTSGHFREDLLYRINTIQVELPPLRVRGDDIIQIANYYLRKFGEKYGKSKLSFSPSVCERISSYNWPGNVRELSHAVERAVIMCEGERISPNDLLIHSTAESNNLGDKPISLNEAEAILIANSIKRNKGNLSAVAKELGIGRQTLYRKIREYGI
ncbi:sigma-54-dependent transcriptional regulator [Perlabentimonas gracilis]|uniref:sigma-54-dependent transcriptional regulator n=1 Tax=Perlabentimonas gracilis TaxID=2715279 RepID=UPI0014086486|nr:sigma-54 dependent transcriptional regulator [Perlabentimonas gracilis]NHB67930.1 sigma-54-dependent Fis family transcriptional regulator [Perlabentimonas gracilis]